MEYFLAIDIGASSGRHIVGWMENGELKTKETYRFPNGQKTEEGHLIWDVESLYQEVENGIAKSFLEFPKIKSLSIDTWGVDYLLMKGEETILPAYAYRDDRTEAAIEKVHKILPFAELYAHTGIQFQPFNSVYQLFADKEAGRLQGVTDFLMIPEYLMYRLTGVKKKEFTNATTTGMVNAKTLRFDEEIFDRLGLPKHLAGELSLPGTVVGDLKPEVQKKVGGNTTVVLCATHDTGSAVEAIDMKTNAPYVSSGTWSLMGLKTPHAFTDDHSRESSYSNEGGVGYNRYQTNITGMWIIQSLRKELCPTRSFDDIERGAKEGSLFDGIINVNANDFLAPKSMKEAIASYFRVRGEEVPCREDDFFRVAYRSLADGYRVALDALRKNTGIDFSELYIVGGGAKNAYLNELTEKTAKVKVIALPIEATAIGNLKIQMKRG